MSTIDYDALRCFGELLADFVLAGGMNDADEACEFLAPENITATLAEMFADWDVPAEEQATLGREYERKFVLDHARQRVEFFAVCD